VIEQQARPAVAAGEPNKRAKETFFVSFVRTTLPDVIGFGVADRLLAFAISLCNHRLSFHGLVI